VGGATVLLETNLILFLTASLALIVAPGPDNILVLTRGVAQASCGGSQAVSWSPWDCGWPSPGASSPPSRERERTTA
jgi:hypothetical protein